MKNKHHEKKQCQLKRCQFSQTGVAGRKQLRARAVLESGGKEVVSGVPA